MTQPAIVGEYTQDRNQRDEEQFRISSQRKSFNDQDKEELEIVESMFTSNLKWFVLLLVLVSTIGPQFFALKYVIMEYNF